MCRWGGRISAILALFVAGALVSHGDVPGPLTATAAAAFAPQAGADNPAWSDAVSAAKLVKSDLNAANYQYSLLGNGGLNALLGPDGFTDGTPPHAPYSPGIFYDYWWDNQTKRVDPFTLSGGVPAAGSVDAGTISSFSQTLDVRTGTLTTSLDLVNCTIGSLGQRDCYPHKSTRSEFITPSGVLVIRVTDSVTASFAVQVGPNENYTLSTDQQAQGLSATANRTESSPLGLSLVAEGDGVQADAQHNLVSASVGPDQPATFYISASGVDSTRPADAAFSAASQAAHAGYSTAGSSNGRFWDQFWQHSNISVPDTSVMTWYIRSQYYLGALMANSNIPPGVYGQRNINFNGGPALGYDQAFPFLALLDANQLDVTAKTADWIEATLPAAEDLAPYYIYNGGPTTGAKYPVVSSWNGKETTAFGPTPAPSGWEAAPSANAALFDILQAQYTSDPARLERAKAVLEKVTQYQLDNSARDPSVGNQWVSQKYYWQWNPAPLSFQKGAITDQAALLWSLREACALRVGPAAWCQDAKQVYIPTAFDPIREERVINGFIGDTPSISNSTFPMLHPFYFLNVLDPQDALAWPTYMNVTSTNDINYTFNRGWSAVVAAKSGYGDDALQRLHRLIDETGEANPSLGVLWNDTFLSECVTCGPTNTPEVGAHGALMLAAQHMLLNGDSDTTVQVFPALPAAWQTAGAAFTKLAANGGLVVSGKYGPDGTDVTIKNASQSPQQRTVLVRVPPGSTAATVRSSSPGLSVQQVTGHGFASIHMRLAPGEVTALTVTGQAAGQWTTVDDASPQVSYTGTWATATDKPGFTDGTVHYTAAAGASATTTFYGTAVRIIADRNTEHGQVRVAIDGKVIGDFDTWAAATTTGNVVFAQEGLTPSRHTITLIASGIQDLYSGGTTVSIDAIEYISSQQGTTVLPGTAAQYSPGWATTPTSDSYKTAYRTGKRGARAVVSFDGSEIRVIGTRGPDGGEFAVAIDGVPQGTVDTYAFTPVTAQELFRSNGLAPGAHRLTITALGAGSANSTGTAVGIQAFDAISSGQRATVPPPYLLAFASPNPVTTSSGGTLTFTLSLWAEAEQPISGVITPSVPPGWSADSASFSIDTHGGPAVAAVPITVHVSPSASGANFQVDFDVTSSMGLQASLAATVSVQNILYSFDDGTTQGWQADPPATNLAAVTTMANGPQVPYQGSHLLQFSTGNISAPSAQRTIYVQPSDPLDLSNAKDVYAYVDSWGIPPYTQAHTATITLYSGAGHISASDPFFGNRWDRLAIDVSAWAGRANITRIEITYTFDIPPDANGGNVYDVQADLDNVGYDT